LGFAGVAGAQVPPPAQIQGTIQSVNCQTGQVTLSTSAGYQTFQASNQTAFYVNGGSVSLCALQQYSGAQATATLVPAWNASYPGGSYGGYYNYPGNGYPGNGYYQGGGYSLSQLNVTAQTSTSPFGSIGSSLGSIGSFLSSPLGSALVSGVIGYLINHNRLGQPVYTPTYNPFNYTTTPVYFPNLPFTLPYTNQYQQGQPMYYQGHNFYQCGNGGWTMNQPCGSGPADPGPGLR
jgi:hypothetical protein